METKMAQNLNELVAAKVELTKHGRVVEATEQFYDDNAKTIDFTGSLTSSRDEMIEKMKGFTAGIQNVNGITFHNSAVSGDISFMEFTFDFDMSDGTKILWHEVIRSVWEDGKIVNEQFFKA